MNRQLSEALAVVATIDPQTVANTELFTDVVDMQKHHQAIGIAQLGNMASETIDFKCYYCESDGSSAVALRSATQLSAHASNNDNKQVVIQIRAADLIASGKRYVKFGLVTGGATGGPASVLVLGGDLRSGPASDNDLASVAEIKAA